MATPTYTICPPGIAHGAEFQRPRFKRSTSALNNYGRLMRTKRPGNVRPGDVAGVMGAVEECLRTEATLDLRDIVEYKRNHLEAA